jgi:hypothetical protein
MLLRMLSGCAKLMFSLDLKQDTQAKVTTAAAMTSSIFKQDSDPNSCPL